MRLIYPPRCVGCGDFVESDFGLCGLCWRDTPFIGGTVCDACGAPLIGENDVGAAHCDDCMVSTRPWAQGRAALLYQGNARRMVLQLKHADRHDVLRPAHIWMAKAAQPLVRPTMLVAPIPLHWTRFVRRRYNQSALLAQGLAKLLGLSYCPDLLLRTKPTKPLDGCGREERFDRLRNVIAPHPRQMSKAAGRPVLLVDDVMTSGATFSAATHACIRSKASDVYVIALARVANRP